MMKMKMSDLDQFPNFTEVVEWPEIQSYMTKAGFIENTALINSEHGIEIYGSSAYRMNPDWKMKVDEGLISEDNIESENLEINIDYGFPYNTEED